MARPHFMTWFTAVLIANSCTAFLVLGPEQTILRHASPPAAPVATTSTTPLSRRTRDVRTLRLSFSANAEYSIADPDSAITATASRRRVGGGAFASSVVDSKRRTAVGALKATGGAEAESEGQDLTAVRRALLLAIWLPFAAYAFGPWSPGAAGDPKDIELVTHLYDAVVPQTALFASIFNALGVLPAIMASMLVGGGAFGKGRQPVPAQPFVFGAFALGFFSVGPYLALRNYLPESPDEGEEMSFLEKALTSKLLAVPVLALAAYIDFSFVSAVTDPEAVSNFFELFWSSKLAHISTLDFCVLSAAIVDPIREDMRRRGMEPELAKVALFSVPMVGPALWMLVRPPVEA